MLARDRAAAAADAGADVFLYAGNVLFAVHPVGYVQDHLADALRITVGGIALASASACSASRSHR